MVLTVFLNCQKHSETLRNTRFDLSNVEIGVEIFTGLFVRVGADVNDLCHKK